jgi:hypothetical protein
MAASVGRSRCDRQMEHFDGRLMRLQTIQSRYGCLVVSHSCAAALHGFEAPSAQSPEFTDDHGRDHSHRLRQVAVHRLNLPAAHVVSARGLRVTSASRTAVDLACSLPHHDAVIALDAVLRAGLGTPDDLRRTINSLSGRHGLPAARQALARTDPRSGSVLESKARLVLWDDGLFPRTQVEIPVSGGRTRRLDMLLEQPSGRPVGVELEGWSYHGSRQDHQRDVWRFNELAAAGVPVILRFTYVDVFRRPQQMIRTIRRALEDARSV